MIFSNTVAMTSKSVFWQTGSAALAPQTQWNRIVTSWSEVQLAFFGHTTPIFSALAGAVLPLGCVTVGVLSNLGKTITLPGSWESLNLGLRVCATAGIAMASAGIISSTDRMVALIELMSPSLTRAVGSYDLDQHTFDIFIEKPNFSVL
jgi:hypothetical protein